MALLVRHLAHLSVRVSHLRVMVAGHRVHVAVLLPPNKCVDILFRILPFSLKIHSKNVSNLNAVGENEESASRDDGFDVQNPHRVIRARVHDYHEELQ